MKRFTGLCFAIISAAAAFAQNQPVPPDKGVIIRGNVNNPGVYPFLAHETVKIVVGEAGGFVRRFVDLAYIYRTDNEGISHTIRINLGKILTGGRPDIELRPGDVVDIPFFLETPPKSRPDIHVPITLPDERA
jgi:protein involved in polysaccharide export with SLBB domain